MRTRANSFVHFFFIAIIAALLFGLFSDKHLSTDGAGYFARILESRTFAHIDWTRRFAEYLTQSPLLGAVNAEVRSLPLLRMIYGFGILAIWLIAWGAAEFALRGDAKSVLLFVLLSMGSINLLSDSILAGEHHVMVLLSWPILFFIIRKSPLSWLDAAVLLGMLFLFSRLYSTAVAPASIILAVSLFRLSHTVSREQKAIYLASALLAVAAIAVSLYAISFPRDPGNSAAFRSAIIRSLFGPEGLTASSFAVLFIFGWLLRRRIVLVASLLPVVAYLWYSTTTGHTLSSGESFGNRSLSLSLLPLWMLGAIAIYWKERTADWGTLLVSGVFIATMIVASLNSTLQWRHFKSTMISTLTQSEALVPLEGTTLRDSRVGWSWTYEVLSVIWSDGCVRSIILNKADVSYQLKGPPEALILGNYTCYEQALSQDRPDLCKCD